jgi:phage gp36-like protein
MIYADVSDMVSRFGEAEMITSSVPDGAAAEAIVPQVIIQKLEDASRIIDGYLRNRYRVPLDLAPPEINRACCMLARYDLLLGGQRFASDAVKDERDRVMRWLKDIAEGKVKLDMAEVAPGGESFSAEQSRPPVFGGDAGYGYGGGFMGGGWFP